LSSGNAAQVIIAAKSVSIKQFARHIYRFKKSPIFKELSLLFRNFLIIAEQIDTDPGGLFSY